MGKRKVKNYSAEFKQSSAKLAVESDESISETARGLGVNPTTLHGWVCNYYPNQVGKQNQTSEQQHPHEELKMLRKQVSRLKQERDILKKAAAYFANETL